MKIDWTALGMVAAVSLAVGVVVGVLVSLALVGLSARERNATALAEDVRTIPRRRSPLSSAAGTATAVVCLVAAAAIVGYGFFLLIF